MREQQKTRGKLKQKQQNQAYHSILCNLVKLISFAYILKWFDGNKAGFIKPHHM
jgi:hypothetical protein